MLTLLFVLIAVGIILETISFRRDPDMVGLEFAISTLSTEPGAPFHVQAIVENNSRLPLSYLAVIEIFPVSTTLPKNMIFKQRPEETHIRKICRVKGRQRKKLTLEASLRKRGVHQFTGDSLEFGDFLGFREISKKVYYRREIVVYPERLYSPDLSEALGRFFGDMAAKRFLIRDPILTVGCREYTGREPMKEIHWLQSAHRNELMVREFDYTRQLSASVIMGVDRIDPADEDGLDLCCSAARSVCESLTDNGVSVNFFTNSHLKRINERELWRCEVSSRHKNSLLEGLGRVSGYAKGSLDALFEFALKNSEYDAAFIIILPASDDRGDETADVLRKKSGRETLLIHMGRLGVPDSGGRLV